MFREVCSSESRNLIDPRPIWGWGKDRPPFLQIPGGRIFSRFVRSLLYAELVDPFLFAQQLYPGHGHLREFEAVLGVLASLEESDLILHLSRSRGRLDGDANTCSFHRGSDDAVNDVERMADSCNGIEISLGCFARRGKCSGTVNDLCRVLLVVVR